ncbi:PREDICTED: vomeronasal type-2 receptor 26-like [Gekko japonicus]|uniref:Vomeronasal type-2 receptor 26-like n=1 Tax=Gekko japonicus TaxID=146911 RepID=A0ABM1KGX3_GEKJA|nr:PREDICTED: vomeronasal type-2 receptor 26-like [Gekko japonicus]
MNSINCTIYNDPFPISYKFYQSGDILIGGIHSPAIFGNNLMFFREHPAQMVIDDPAIVTKRYQHMLAMEFAIKEINDNPNFLSNISLGFYNLNSYPIGSMTYQATLNLLSANQKLVPNFSCATQKKLIALIGGLLSEISANIATILNIYKTPQLTYGSYPLTQDDKKQFPFVYQMVPNEAYEHRGVVLLLHHFGWTWVGLLAVNDDSGDTFLQTIVPILTENSICVAFTFRLPKPSYMEEFTDFFLLQWGKYPLLLNRKANVCYVYGQTSAMIMLHAILFQAPIFLFPLPGKVWITTSHWDFESSSVQRLWDIESFHGALSFAIHSNQPPRFQQFLQTIRPSWDGEDGFIQDFWEQAFSCSLKVLNEEEENKQTCTGEEKLETLPGVLFEMGMTGHSYNVYNAVYSLAHVLNDIHLLKSKHKRLVGGGRLDFQNVQPSQIHTSLQSILFNNSAGDIVRFDNYNELVSDFDVTNWVTFPNGSFVRVKVGRLDPHAPPGKELNLNDAQIVWHRSFNQVLPLSMCNDHCLPGYSKRKKEGEKFCCYDCSPCPEGMFSDQMGRRYMETCVKCPDDLYPSRGRKQCIPKHIIYLSYQEPLGMMLAMLAISLSTVTLLVLGTFIQHKNTPIVKANNRSLTYILLICLLLCFLCSLLFIGKPEKVTCLLRQVTFGMVFSLALSSVLAKTITVILAFLATKPGSRMRKWVGKKLSNCIVLSASIIQAAICTLWLSTSPPFPDQDLHSVPGEIILQCNEGSAAMFYCVVGYMGFLAIVSFTVAFLARNLPDIFNEAKFITFSMLVFCSVCLLGIWLSIFPNYLSNKGKSILIVEITFFLSCSGLLLCIFLFKYCILLLRPEMDTGEQMIRRKD